MLKPSIETPVRLRAPKRLAQAAIVGVALTLATAASALAAPAAPTPACVSIPGATTVVSLVSDANGQLSLPCTPQPGQQLLIVGQGTLVSSPQVTSTPAPAAAVQQGDDHLGTMVDPRVDTYAKRQAIRDKYQGLINNTTFNDELGDGVGLDQALADAMVELGKGH